MDYPQRKSIHMTIIDNHIYAHTDTLTHNIIAVSWRWDNGLVVMVWWGVVMVQWIRHMP